jgi:hypothetical protein
MVLCRGHWGEKKNRREKKDKDVQNPTISFHKKEV